jgi:hypothetical protein
MQRNSVPTTISYNVGNDLIAGKVVRFLQLQKQLFLFLISVQWDANGSLHGQELFLNFTLHAIFKKGAALPPSPKGLEVTHILKNI